MAIATLPRRLLLAAALVGATALGTYTLVDTAQADQPRMRAALDALEVAKANLQAASSNKGGHRANAIKLVNAAISEVRAGIAFAQ